MKNPNMNKFSYTLFLSLIFTLPAHSAEDKYVDHNQMMDHGDGHLMDMEGGMVMGQNKDKLPGGCDKISEDKQITVHGGHKYSKKFPGTMFSFDTQEWRVKPCTRLSVTFINEDNVRHQWMMHGLPKYMYDKGMFHLEVTGPGKITGTLILPAEDKTYLVHCDIAQHMEKGMKGQLIVGKGSGTFPSIPGLTDPAIPDDYGPAKAPTADANGTTTTVAASKDAALSAPVSSTNPPVSASEDESSFFSGSLIIGVLIGLAGTPLALRYAGDRFKGMGTAEVISSLFGALGDLIKALIGIARWIYDLITGKKYLPKQ